MSRQIIADLERDLEKVLVRYETEKEITTAEIVGTLSIVASQRRLKAILSYNVPFLRDLLEMPLEAVSGPPLGTVKLEREDDAMET